MTDAPAKPVRLADGAQLDSFVDEHDAALVEFYRESKASASGLDPEGEADT